MDAEQVRIAYENAKELHKEGVSVTELYDLKQDYEERELYNYVTGYNIAILEILKG
ncbi:hypothetical protein [uncultured Mediterranean phage uvMED]|nr:hypothetical protein [uncultured Mediterranean phage uvMED]